MSRVPAQPKIYHITPVDNLPGMLADGCLVSDATIVARGGPAVVIGMSEIKKRRIESLEVSCHPGTKVGDYVPFYFCPRSVMLYVIHMANHPSLTYRGGEGPIVHLEADLHEVVAWADRHEKRWAFSLSNAGSFYAQFRAQVEQLTELDWPHIQATDFYRAEVKEAKQAEFLVHEQFPLKLVSRIGTHSENIRKRVQELLRGCEHVPLVEVRPDWYY
ncbi:MAG: DUF4433 domain-containing protein [candidate division WOR-3 bacterium]|nr:DUF4433 domain-containing protein [candidate division WOR-3 bacterium]